MQPPLRYKQQRQSRPTPTMTPSATHLQMLFELNLPATLPYIIGG
jgi:hypothetical protein